MIWNPFRKVKTVETERSMPTVKFDADRVTSDIQTVIAQTIEGIPDVDPEHRALLIEAAIEASRRGRDIYYLASTAISVGIEKKRAGAIARYVVNVASSRMNVAKQLSLGLTEAKWSHSGAPCGRNKPGTEQLASSHLDANGKTYDLRRGLKIGNNYIYPGEDEGCMCFSQVIIPGFDN